MTTNYKNCKWQLWLTSFLATSGVWIYFGSSAFAQNAGTITINTGSLTVRDGASLTAVNNRSGSAGTLTIRATDSVLISPGGYLTIGDEALLTAVNSGSGSAGTLTINTHGLSIHDGASISSKSSGRAGMLMINTDGLSIRGGGSVSSESSNILLNPVASVSATTSGLRNAGTISISAGSISLSRRDLIPITAGGNIEVKGSTFSSITSGSRASGSGGNISITANKIIRVSIPEPSSMLGVLASVALSAVSVLKCKRKNRQLHIN